MRINLKKTILWLTELEYLMIVLFGILIVVLQIFNIRSALVIKDTFWLFFLEMISYLPCMFILIGLFDIWFPREKIEKHIGKESGFRGMLWCILLAMFQAGPLYGAFPVAYLLWQKGASVRNIFVYLGAFSTLKIPMLTFEISFLGLKFTLFRTITTLPVFIIIAYIIELYLKNKNFNISKPE